MQTFFAAQWNSDQTEGKGVTVTGGIFSEVEPAYALVKNKGGMGVSDGNIALVYVYDSIDEMRSHQATNPERYAYHGWQKQWTPGYKIRDPRMSDPEYQLLIEKRREAEKIDAEISRLENKFR